MCFIYYFGESLLFELKDCRSRRPLDRLLDLLRKFYYRDISDYGISVIEGCSYAIYAKGNVVSDIFSIIRRNIMRDRRRNICTIRVVHIDRENESLVVSSGCYIARGSKYRAKYHAKYINLFAFNDTYSRVLYGVYHGSTNFTAPGMAVNNRGIGNFENFACYKGLMPYNLSSSRKPPCAPGRTRLANYIIDHLTLALEVISRNRSCVTETERLVNQIIDVLSKIIGGGASENVSALAKEYADLCDITYNVISSVMDLPGRKLVDKFIVPKTNMLRETNVLPSPIDLEVIWSATPETLSYYGLTAKVLKEKITKLKEFLVEIREFLEKEYVPKLPITTEYMYDYERDYVNFIREHSENHIKLVKEIIEKLRRLGGILELR